MLCFYLIILKCEETFFLMTFPACTLHVNTCIQSNACVYIHWMYCVHYMIMCILWWVGCWGLSQAWESFYRVCVCVCGITSGFLVLYSSYCPSVCLCLGPPRKRDYTSRGGIGWVSWEVIYSLQSSLLHPGTVNTQFTAAFDFGSIKKTRIY